MKKYTQEISHGIGSSHINELSSEVDRIIEQIMEAQGLRKDDEGSKKRLAKYLFSPLVLQQDRSTGIAKTQMEFGMSSSC